LTALDETSSSIPMRSSLDFRDRGGLITVPDGGREPGPARRWAP
jgi:hypothetical protein